jgi:hypothetical protein
MKRVTVPFGLLLAGALVVWWLGAHPPQAASAPLTPEAIARLEPELCEPSGLTQFLTIVPIAPHSYSTSLAPDQLALVDAYKGSGWRKVWVLRLPAAFITQRTCDLGRRNWTGDGDSRTVSQLYELGLVLTRDGILPVTRVAQEVRDGGLAVSVHLSNHVMNPDKRHRMNAQRSMVNGHLDAQHPLRCREDEGQVPGLVRFRRIDPNERGGVRCGSRGAEGSKWENKVFGRKIGELTYEFIADCSVNCRIYSDYNGWDIELMFPYERLAEWSLVLDGVHKFFDEHTAYIDHDDDPNARR